MKKLTTLLFLMLFTTSIGLAQHTATTSQSGNNNDAIVNQDGTKGSNNAEISQSGDENKADIRQKGDSPLDSPLDPAGFTNHVFVEQSGGSKATINQTGRDYVNLEQSGGSIAEIQQDFGEKQIVRGANNEEATQTGGSKLYVRQQGTQELGSSGARRLGSELRIEQFGGVLGGGHVTDIKQRDGAFAEIIQVSVFSNSSALVRQDGDSDIYLEQNSAFGSSTADISQQGDNNLVTGLSGGTSRALQGANGGHSLTIDQTSAFNGGAGNTAKVLQDGFGQTATVSQNGSGNVTTVSQQ